MSKSKRARPIKARGDRQPSVPQRWCKAQGSVQRFPLYSRPEPTQSQMESLPA
jgi:hypothetical protein